MGVNYHKQHRYKLRRRLAVANKYIDTSQKEDFPTFFLKNVADNNLRSKEFPLGICEGDCDSDNECRGDLICFQRQSNEPVPGCHGVGIFSTDYCAKRHIVDGKNPPLLENNNLTSNNHRGARDGKIEYWRLATSISVFVAFLVCAYVLTRKRKRLGCASIIWKRYYYRRGAAEASNVIINDNEGSTSRFSRSLSFSTHSDYRGRVTSSTRSSHRFGRRRSSSLSQLNDDIAEQESYARQIQQQLNDEEVERILERKRKERREKYGALLENTTMFIQEKDVTFMVTADDTNLVDEVTSHGMEQSKDKESLTSEETDDDDDDDNGARVIRHVNLPLRDERANCNRRVDGQCIICIHNYEIGDRIVWSTNLHCNHAYHYECLMLWMSKGKKRCPVCRHYFCPLRNKKQVMDVTDNNNSNEGADGERQHQEADDEGENIDENSNDNNTDTDNVEVSVSDNDGTAISYGSSNVDIHNDEGHQMCN